MATITLSNSASFNLAGYDYEKFGGELELSTKLLIRSAQQHDIAVDILDAQENFIRLRRNQKIEYVRQATMTASDVLVSYFLMENKSVTKKILEESGINTPKGSSYSCENDAISEYTTHYSHQKIVVKPNSTNFGLGVQILPENSFNLYRRAVKRAFSYSSQIIVEKFTVGTEYRFLVIENGVLAIVNRVPANVIGNGVDSIAQLIAAKNLDPQRGSNYSYPLIHIEMGEVERSFLADQGLDFTSIPALDQQVFLRRNSNISTGGDSIDATDIIPQCYKDLAVRSAQLAGARICGVDMIIPDCDVENGDYVIIELNFNPALHIHAFPARGEQRDASVDILKLLGFSL